MRLELDKCTVRPWTLADVRDLVRYANDKAVWANLRNHFPHPYTEGDARQYINFSNSQKPLCNYAIEVNGRAAGSVGFLLKKDVYANSIELGYWLAKEFWGQGITTCAVRAMVSYIWKEFDPIRVYACCFDWNKASGKVLTKCGFHLEARLERHVVKDGRLGDELIYAMIKK
ncbi:GNAT family N-acetyltransferase [Roseivirga sp. BDSF3-8]|uniref:GNAT family N-acetyltransferase n=1 Tax=Roseivirga sp. BDSF3-8 TaxID=3241598 RepID=UPI003531C297